MTRFPRKYIFPRKMTPLSKSLFPKTRTGDHQGLLTENMLRNVDCQPSQGFTVHILNNKGSEKSCNKNKTKQNMEPPSGHLFLTLVLTTNSFSPLIQIWFTVKAADLGGIWRYWSESWGLGRPWQAGPSLPRPAEFLLLAKCALFLSPCGFSPPPANKSA